MKIIAGQFGGRKLLSPPEGSSTRPITGLAKQSLFDSLAPWLEGATVLDLYCGSGTMGIEALSRGSDHCFFAELDGRVVRTLKQNIQTLGIERRSTVWQGDVERRLVGWLSEVSRPVDLAFIDPPYAASRAWDWPAIEKALFEPTAAALADDGLLVLRTPGEVQSPDMLGPLAVAREKSYGSMRITVWHKQAPRPQ